MTSSHFRIFLTPTPGLLTAGALGSVAYSYVAADPSLASSAVSLAQGAVDSIARNDIVQMASNALGSVAGRLRPPSPPHLSGTGGDYGIGNTDYSGKV